MDSRTSKLLRQRILFELGNAIEKTRTALTVRDVGKRKDLVWEAALHTELAIGNATMLSQEIEFPMSARATKRSKEADLRKKVGTEEGLAEVKDLLESSIQFINSESAKKALQRARAARNLLNELHSEISKE